MTKELPTWVPASLSSTLLERGWFANRFGEIEHAGGYVVKTDEVAGRLVFREPGKMSTLTAAETWPLALAVPVTDSFEVAERTRRAMDAYEQRHRALGAQYGCIPISDALLSAAFDVVSALIGTREHVCARDIVREHDRAAYDAEFARLIEPIAVT